MNTPLTQKEFKTLCEEWKQRTNHKACEDDYYCGWEQAADWLFTQLDSKPKPTQSDKHALNNYRLLKGIAS